MKKWYAIFTLVGVLVALTIASVAFGQTPIQFSGADPGGGGGNPCSGSSCIYDDGVCFWSVTNYGRNWQLLTCRH